MLRAPLRALRPCQRGVVRRTIVAEASAAKPNSARVLTIRLSSQVTPATQRKNMALATMLVGFTGAVYYASMNKLKQACCCAHAAAHAAARHATLRRAKAAPSLTARVLWRAVQTDDLSELEVGKVNAHQSGLKLDRAPDRQSPAEPEPAAPEPKKQTGWRRVVFFWRN